jgi:hypothetical protein
VVEGTGRCRYDFTVQGLAVDAVLVAAESVLLPGKQPLSDHLPNIPATPN